MRIRVRTGKVTRQQYLTYESIVHLVALHLQANCGE